MELGLVAHFFNLTFGGQSKWISELIASLIYIVSSRLDRHTKGDPVSKTK